VYSIYIGVTVFSNFKLIIVFILQITIIFKFIILKTKQKNPHPNYLSISQNFKIMVKVKTGVDRKITDVPMQIMEQCETLKDLMGDTVEGETEEPILVNNHKATTLEHLIAYGMSPKTETEKMEKEWINQFLVERNLTGTQCEKLDERTDLLLLANFLNYRSLVEFATQEKANEILGKTPEEIRSIWYLKNDFTPEEEARVNAQNEWNDEDEEDVEEC